MLYKAKLPPATLASHMGKSSCASALLAVRLVVTVPGKAEDGPVLSPSTHMRDLGGFLALISSLVRLWPL